MGKNGRLLAKESTYKITCYKSYPDMPPLDAVPRPVFTSCDTKMVEFVEADGSSFHIVAHGESKESIQLDEIIPESAG